MCFSFGRLAQCWLPETVQFQVKRQYRLIWLEMVVDQPLAVGYSPLAKSIC
jgi:hypothetical protein